MTKNTATQHKGTREMLGVEIKCEKLIVFFRVRFVSFRFVCLVGELFLFGVAGGAGCLSLCSILLYLLW